MSRIAKLGARLLPALLSLAGAEAGATTAPRAVERDIVIYGATSAGIAAAVQATRMGKSVVIVEPGNRIGGLTAGGLGQTDIGNKHAIGGISLEFYKAVRGHYDDPAAWKWQDPGSYKSRGQSSTLAGEAAMWTFEPSVALNIFEQWVRRDHIEIIKNERLDREDGAIFIPGGKGPRLAGFRAESGREFRGRMFIDATYEGDLMALAGVSHAVGREANALYNETFNGAQAKNASGNQLRPGIDPYARKGDPSSGLLPLIDPSGPGVDGAGDRRVQAYCFRMCLSDHPDNRIPFHKPEGYREDWYELLFRNFEAGEKKLPCQNSPMPNRKTDTNNDTGFSTDFIGQNYDYPKADYKTRGEIVRRHLLYQQGLMWTLANHPRVPAAIREEASRWGVAKDEFVETGGWPGQLYIREARRMVGALVMTQHHCQGRELVEDPVGMAAYTMDSHNTRRHVDANGHVRNEGDVQVKGFPPYPVGYRALIPREGECENLIVPVCMSASHIAYGSIRMEPVFMIFGQSAATAAALAIDDRVSVQKVDYNKLRQRLLKDGQVLSASNGMLPDRIDLSSGWRMQAASKAGASAGTLSEKTFQPENWHKATVPGTVLTTLVDNGVYPDPLYGGNNRPDRIPDSLCREPYWYRTTFVVPKNDKDRRIWLNFDGINYAAEIWVNARRAGAMRGAFARGVFDITDLVSPGTRATLAVLVSPQPNPGNPHERTMINGTGPNGGVSALDGPTFLCSIGWDWIPPVRDRNTGIWQKVFLSTSGPVIIKDPRVLTRFPSAGFDLAELTLEATVQNVTERPQRGTLHAIVDGIAIQAWTELPPRAAKTIRMGAKDFPQLRMANPRLWWPNGYGPQNLYKLRLSFDIAGFPSDRKDVTFGIRKITYSVPGSDNLALSVNGVRVMCKGGNWGMDEAMKRIPRERLEAQIRMHQLANYNMIRNWVGQSTSDAFYELCDHYGMLVWDEFFQPNPGDGPDPADLDTYLANVREKILRYRNHPSIALWCARNEGRPPPEIDSALRALMAELDPDRHYQPSSTDGHGVYSHGPYAWREPQAFYQYRESEAFKTEIGSVSMPTLESIQGMLPEEDWNIINDNWAGRDMARGAQAGDIYHKKIAGRYGRIANLADFARKGQLANYEAFRAMYEGRHSKLFEPCTGTLTWMSNPAQPSFVWQLYHHDLEPNAALFAVRNACESVHVQLNEQTWAVEVVNNRPELLDGLGVVATLYDLDGSIAGRQTFPLNAPGSAVTGAGALEWPEKISAVHFVRLELTDAAGDLLSRNFYWRASPRSPNDLTLLESLPVVNLKATASRRDAKGRCVLEVILRNPTSQIALLAHLQLRRRGSEERVLPVYYSDNYISLAPGETRAVEIEADVAALRGEAPVIFIDGWNIGVESDPASDVLVTPNRNAQVSRWPDAGMSVYYGPARTSHRLHCGGAGAGDFSADTRPFKLDLPPVRAAMDTSFPGTGPEAIYQKGGVGRAVYVFPMERPPGGFSYKVRMHFAETEGKGMGERLFNVKIHEKQVMKELDVFQQAGGPNKALVREFAGILPDEDGNIVIRLERATPRKGEPFINAIEVLPGW
jgi:hypothetical protein